MTKAKNSKTRCAGFKRTLGGMTLALVLACAPSLASEEKSRKEMCDLAAVLVTQGGKAASEFIQALFDWNPPVAKTVESTFSVLENYTFMDAAVFSIGDFDDFAQEYFVPGVTQSKGSIYFRFRYERANAAFLLVNAKFKDSLPKIMAEEAMANPPKAIDCG